MENIMVRYVFVAISVVICVAVGPLSAAQKLEAHEMAFLEEAAQQQLAEIALGKLAMKRAAGKSVKEFGAQLVEDHQYASQEMKELSAKEGIYLPVEMNDEQKHEQERLSHVPGKDFDKAFITHLLKTHRRHLQQLRNNAAMLKHERVKQWAEATEPILAVHLKKAEHVAETLGLKAD
jgi:putative membrane protein